MNVCGDVIIIFFFSEVVLYTCISLYLFVSTGARYFTKEKYWSLQFMQ